MRKNGSPSMLQVIGIVESKAADSLLSSSSPDCEPGTLKIGHHLGFTEGPGIGACVQRRPVNMRASGRPFGCVQLLSGFSERGTTHDKSYKCELLLMNTVASSSSRTCHALEVVQKPCLSVRRGSVRQVIESRREQCFSII